MSQENVEIVRRAFETFAQEGPEAMVAFGDPDIELWLPSGMIQAGGTYRGHEAVVEWIKEWAEAWEEKQGARGVPLGRSAGNAPP
jgi:ketosteroid isomerase-like protein